MLIPTDASCCGTPADLHTCEQTHFPCSHFYAWYPVFLEPKTFSYYITHVTFFIKREKNNNLGEINKTSYVIQEYLKFIDINEILCIYTYHLSRAFPQQVQGYEIWTYFPSRGSFSPTTPWFSCRKKMKKRRRRECCSHNEQVHCMQFKMIFSTPFGTIIDAYSESWGMNLSSNWIIFLFFKLSWSWNEIISSIQI